MLYHNVNKSKFPALPVTWQIHSIETINQPHRNMSHDICRLVSRCDTSVAGDRRHDRQRATLEQRSTNFRAFKPGLTPPRHYSVV
ncbi:hypothetical protein LSTR_LSTR004471 [Laodelphax striatellus]|uniref:Uncharacterized protein n=1 Tax=Laodelphax striatellus TaxID=195883 RepID=A0A482XF42_LAOST|nr:hypothetical protein LSTR_LSTR004471 [Laodelphax striatellus]